MEGKCEQHVPSSGNFRAADAVTSLGGQRGMQAGEMEDQLRHHSEGLDAQMSAEGLDLSAPGNLIRLSSTVPSRRSSQPVQRSTPMPEANRSFSVHSSASKRGESRTLAKASLSRTSGDGGRWEYVADDVESVGSLKDLFWKGSDQSIDLLSDRGKIVRRRTHFVEPMPSSFEEPHALMKDLVENVSTDRRRSMATGFDVRRGRSKGLSRSVYSYLRGLKSNEAPQFQKALDAMNRVFLDDIYKELQARVAELETTSRETIFSTEGDEGRSKNVVGSLRSQEVHPSAIDEKGTLEKIPHAELVQQPLDAEWAFEQFSGKRLDTSSNFEDDLTQLYNIPSCEGLHGYSPYRTEAPKDRYERLLDEVPKAIATVEDYTTYLDELEKLDDDDAGTPSNAAYILKLNVALAQSKAGLGTHLLECVSTDVDLQNLLFTQKRIPTQFESEVDFYDVYCAPDFVPFVAMARTMHDQFCRGDCKEVKNSSSLRGDARIEIVDPNQTDGAAWRSFVLRGRKLEARLERLQALVSTNSDYAIMDRYGAVSLTNHESNTGRHVCDEFESTSLCDSVALVNMIISLAMDSTLVDRFQTRLQLLNCTMDEQHQLLEDARRRQKRQRQRWDDERGSVEDEDYCAEFKPDRLIQNLHRDLMPFKEAGASIQSIAYRMATIGGQFSEVAALLGSCTAQTKQHDILNAKLADIACVSRGLESASKPEYQACTANRSI